MLTHSLQRTAWILRGTGRHGAHFTSTKNALFALATNLSRNFISRGWERQILGKT
jgi:predicted component of type VI protein secretion system